MKTETVFNIYSINRTTGLTMRDGGTSYSTRAEAESVIAEKMPTTLKKLRFEIREEEGTPGKVKASRTTEKYEVAEKEALREAGRDGFMDEI